MFLACGDEDVGEDDEGWQEETGSLREPPPQVGERTKGQQFGRKIDCSKNDLYHVDTHLEQPTAKSFISQPNGLQR